MTQSLDSLLSQPRTCTGCESKMESFIRNYVARNGMAPSVREMSAAFGLAHVTVMRRLESLESKGVLKRSRNRGRRIARSIRLVNAVNADVPMLRETIRLLLAQTRMLSVDDVGASDVDAFIDFVRKRSVQ